MKILMVGNTNNYPFILARAFAEQGHEIVQVIDQSYELHRPENRYRGVDFKDIRLLDISPLRFRNAVLPAGRRRMIQAIADESDLVIANGVAPRILNLKHNAMYMLYTGSDLTDLALSERPKPGAPDLRNKLLSAPFGGLEAAVVRRGQSQLSRCIGFSFFAKDSIPLGELSLVKMQPTARRLQILMSDASEFAHLYRDNEGGQNFRIFNVARISWHSEEPSSRTALDYKGTDTLLMGFKSFLDRTGAEATLVLVLKGPDINRAKELIENLGISSKVEWNSEMTQKQVFYQYAIADVITENLGPGLIGMGGLDALGFGKPVIAHSGISQYGDLKISESPILEALDEQDVGRHLCDLYAHSRYRQQVAESSLKFALEHLDPKLTADRILELLG